MAVTNSLNPVSEDTKKVAFYTLGCKLNFSETASIARDFDNENFQRVDFDSSADIYVINTCSVTDNADKKFKGLVKKALKRNPNAFVAAIGCYAQLQPEELAAIEGVDLVLGATEKFKLTAYLNDLAKKAIVSPKYRDKTTLEPVKPIRKYATTCIKPCQTDAIQDARILGS